MHADMGLTCVFRSIEQKDNYRLDWLKKTVKKLIQSQSQSFKTSREFSYLVQKDTFKSFKTPRELSDLVQKGNLNVEYVIDPIINIFKDYKGLNSLAVNMGFNYYYDSIIEEERHDIILNLNMVIIQNIDTLIQSEYGAKRFCYGICMDNLYIASSKEKELKIGSFFFSNPNPLDEYFWPGFDSSVIYSIFPESKITLPKDLSFRIKHFKA